MATSVQNFRGRGLPMSDLDLIILMSFVTDIAKQQDGEKALHPLITAWQESQDQYGPGMLDLKLDSFLANPAEAESFQRILSRVKEMILGHGDLLPATELQKRV